MTVQEALDHDWQVGEKLWEVYYTYPRNLAMQFKGFNEYFPVGVIEVTVKEVKRSETEYKKSFESVGVVLEADWGMREDDIPYHNTQLAAMITHSSIQPDFYTHLEFCEDKFFNKEDAEKRYREVAEYWNKKLKQFHKKQLKKLENARKEYEKLLAEGVINVEEYLIK